MLPIYICEDIAEELNLYTGCIARIVAEQFSGEMKIVCAAQGPDEVLRCLQRYNVRPGIYFLDIDLGPDVINGIDLGVRIREYDPRGYIIMVTAHSELAPLTFKYKVEAMDYIMKDNTEEVPGRIRECLQRALELEAEAKKQVQQKAVVFRVGSSVVTKNPDDIYVIKAVPNYHKIVIHEGQSQTVMPLALGEVETMFGTDFYRCGKSIIININHIESIGINTVKMTNDITIPIPIRKIPDLKKYDKRFRSS